MMESDAELMGEIAELATDILYTKLLENGAAK